tara:strand:- start:15736 stop:17598 length:1863 start_codon:yes stop_codon:yes gene_type:complete
MFELEIVSDHPNSNACLPAEDPPTAWLKDVEAISLLPWEEHCTECAMPACFQTCTLYQPRNDGKCRRFQNGIQLIRETVPDRLPIVRIEFKRWGRLFAYGKRALVPVKHASRMQRLVSAAESLATHRVTRNIALGSRKAIVARLVRRFKQRIANSKSSSRISASPTHFVAQVYAHESSPAPITISFSAKNQPKLRTQHLAPLRQGWNFVEVPYSRFEKVFRSATGFSIAIDPNLGDETEQTRVFCFSTLAFIRRLPQNENFSRPRPPHIDKQLSGKPVKAVIWDLDNTVWDGVLTEDGENHIHAKSFILDTIKTLDSRGIVQSVASKNDHEFAKRTLQRLGIWDFFVFSKINWQPKSGNAKAIIADLNINADSVLFVDDSEFERAEVSASVPTIRCLHPDDIELAMSHANLNPVVSQEGASRRQSYQAAETRASVANEFDDYEQFLVSCELEMEIREMAEADLQRSFELVTRTNQLNFSGTRYSQEELKEISLQPDSHIYLATCRDRFGDYGTVGIAITEQVDDERIVSEFALSCRVQSKRVEHFFLWWLYEQAMNTGAMGLHVSFHPTPRNAAAGQVFDDLSASSCDEHASCFFLAGESFQCLDRNLVRVNHAPCSETD